MKTYTGNSPGQTFGRAVLSCTGVITAICLVVFAAPAQADDKPAPKRGDWKMWGGAPDRNMTSDEVNIPATWDIKTGKNILWQVPLGSQTYGNPSIADGRLFVGTNNEHAYRPHLTGDKGILICFEEKTGKFLWQATHDKLPAGRVNDWPDQGICSAPLVDGNYVYYVSNRAELICADVNGFLDGKNDGPFKDEKYNEKEDADFIWVLDMIEDLAVFPHNLATSSPVIGGDLIFIVTSNGVDEGHLNLPSPDAPSFLAVNKKTGEVVWEDSTPGKSVLHGQWGSPAYGVIGGEAQVIFPGGDGWCYSFEPTKGKLLWKFDLNPKDSKWALGGRGTRNNIIATPVIYEEKVYLCVGQDPEHGEGVGHLYCIDAKKRGDITESGKVWHYGMDDFRRSISTCAIRDGLVYAADLSGFVNCLDAKTGKPYWKHDTFAAIWGSPMVVDGKVFQGTEDGDVLVFEHGKKKKLIATNNMGNSAYSTPVPSNGVLYITNKNTLFAIGHKDAAKEESKDKAAMK